MKTKAIRASAKRSKPATPAANGSIEMKPRASATRGGGALREAIRRELPSLLTIRHDLHRHPELSFKEKRTSEVVQRELDALGIRYRTGLGGGTGVVAYLPPSEKADASKPSIALRADMDALPIVEQTGVAYSSKTPGVMHACGHDGHTTILLGAARILNAMPRPNPVTLVFQPAEEHEGGGKIMCQEGVMKGDKGAGLGNPIGRIYGLHGWPQLSLGTIASRPGPLMACVDDFIVTIKGTQSHGAYPHLSKDPIVAAAHVVTAVQTIASRNVGPLDAIVVTVGQIEGGTANNIIPESVKLVGTVRTLRDEIKVLARERFIAIVQGTARALGCEATVDYHDGYPVTANDPREFERVMGVARGVVGEAHTVTLDNPTMGGEDFAFYGKHVPACFFFLGLRPATAGDDYPSLHQPNFNFNDEAMPTGIEMFVRLATM